MSFADVDKLTKLIPNATQHQAEGRAWSRSRESKTSRRKDPRVKEVLDVGAAAGGHGAQLRACTRPGVVISPAAAASELVPLYKTNKDEIVTQYDMSGPGKAGPAEDGFPGADDADDHPGCAGADQEDARRASWSWKNCRSTIRTTYERSSPRASPAACSSSNRRACSDILRRYQPEPHRRPDAR